MSEADKVREMWLRDEYAGRVLQAFLSMPETTLAIDNGNMSVNALCVSCYRWADAMLRARKA